MHTLQNYAERHENTFFWFDVFCVNQNASSDLPQDWWSTTFLRNIRTIGKVVLVLSPWSNPVPLTRCWCLWEIKCAIEASSDNVDFEVLLSSEEKANFTSDLKQPEKDQQAIQSLFDIQSEKAEAFVPRDKDMIFKAIEEGIGFSRLNQLVKEHLRRWFVATMEEIMINISGEDEGTEEAYHIYSNVSSILQTFGLYDRAVEVLNNGLDAIKSTRQLLEADSKPVPPTVVRKTAMLQTCLGSVYFSKGSLDEAMNWYCLALNLLGQTPVEEFLNAVSLTKEEANNDIENSRGGTTVIEDMVELDNCVPVANVVISIGEVHRVRKELKEAISCYKVGMKLYKRKGYAKDSDTVAVPLGNMAIALSDLGQYDQALECYLQQLQTYTTLYGERSPSLCIAMNNIADTYQHLGDFETSLQYYNKCLEAYSTNYGDQHHTVGSVLYNIGIVYESKGEYQKATEYCNQALPIYLATYGDMHASVARVYNTMGNSFCYMNLFEDAMRCYNHTVCIFKDSFGDSYPSLALTYNNMGYTLSKMMQYEASLEHYEHALRIKLSAYGDEHPSVANTYNSMASLYRRLGRFDDALEVLMKGLLIRRKVFGESHSSVGSSFLEIGNVYWVQSCYDEARSNYEKALAIVIPALGDTHPTVASLYNNLGGVLRCMNHYLAAVDFLRKSVDIRFLRLGEEHPLTIGTMETLGNVFFVQGKYHDAEEWGSRALKNSLLTNGVSHPSTLQLHAFIAKVHLKKGNVDLAMKSLESAWLDKGHLITANNDDYQRVCGPVAGDVDSDYVESELLVVAAEYHLFQAKNGKGNLNNARGFAERALSIASSDESRIASSIILARVFCAQQEYTTAIQRSDAAVALVAAIQQPSFPQLDMAIALATGGDACLGLGDLSGAEENYYTKALAILQAMFVSDNGESHIHPEAIPLYEGLKAIAASKGKLQSVSDCDDSIKRIEDYFFS
eukprot:m.90722 g.90722  ORF g.90722 m.90722 type:complete len:960 (+) comp8854_c2_seq2:252-3131(+)